MRYFRLLTAIGALGVLCLALTGCPDKKPKYPNCSSDKNCEDGEHCVAKKCLQCGDDSHCEAGQECTAGACVAKAGWCNADDDCPDHKLCKENVCVACQSDNQCGGGRCVEGGCLQPGECMKDEDCQDDEDCVAGKCQQLGIGDTAPPEIQCSLNTVFFDFDTSRIREEMRSVIDDNATCLKETDRTVYLIGHTDPRGTDEYNIALSDGRARAVADYLARLGIDPARFHVIPKGAAESEGASEDSWSQDRKVEFVWK